MFTEPLLNKGSINDVMKGSMAIEEGFEEASRNRSESMTGGLYGDETNNGLMYGLTEKQRRSQIKKNLLFGMYELLLVCVAIFIILTLLYLNYRITQAQIYTKDNFFQQSLKNPAKL